MTTEETELTFVRCSNCRSLIPAIATRCRMCGAQFEKKADAGETPGSQDSQSQNRQSRVRQRTISASADEVEQLKRDAFVPQQQEQTPPPASSFRLGGGAPPREAPQPPPMESIRNYAAPEIAEESFEEEAAVAEEDYDESLATHHSPSKESFRFVDRVSQQDDDWNDEGDVAGEENGLGDEEEEDMADDIMSDDGSHPAHAARGEGRKKRRRRRRKRSQNPIGGESLDSHSEHARPELHAPVEEPHYERSEPERMAAPMATQSREREQRRNEPAPSSAEPQAVRGEGKLVGWLVSFGDSAQGVSTEIRAGRFFLGRQRLRGNDFIIPHQSISTPHCMIVAGGTDSLVIQDLMSEGGTQLRRAGESSFSPITNAINVQHGDWVRFGQYEAMVCLLPKGRAS